MLLLILPVLNQRAILRGCLFSLLPSAMMLFLVLPGMGKGTFGFGFGTITPAVVIGLNCIYGLVASLWYERAIRNSDGMKNG